MLPRLTAVISVCKAAIERTGLTTCQKDGIAKRKELALAGLPKYVVGPRKEVEYKEKERVTGKGPEPFSEQALHERVQNGTEAV